jgi:hypothetical protein
MARGAKAKKFAKTVGMNAQKFAQARMQNVALALLIANGLARNVLSCAQPINKSVGPKIMTMGRGVRCVSLCMTLVLAQVAAAQDDCALVSIIACPAQRSALSIALMINKCAIKFLTTQMVLKTKVQRLNTLASHRMTIALVVLTRSHAASSGACH